MHAPVAASAAPTYLEFAPAAGDGLSPPQAASAAALLRDYFGILAFFFAKPGADRSAAAVAQAFANLPGLLLHDSSHGRSRYAWSPHDPGTVADDLAGTLAGVWAGLADAAELSPLTAPIVASLEPGASTGDRGTIGGSEGGTSATTWVLIVLRRPDGATPTLGYTVLDLNVDASTPASGSHPRPARDIALHWTSTEFVVLDDRLDQARQFAQQMIRNDGIGDAGLRSDYLAIPLR